MRTLIPLLILGAALAGEPPELLPLPRLDATIDAPADAAAPPLVVVGTLSAGWQPQLLGEDAGIRWGARPLSTDAAAAAALIRPQAPDPGAEPALLAPTVDAPLVAVLALPSTDDSVGVARVIRAGTTVRIVVERDASPRRRSGPPRMRVVVLPIGAFPVGAHQIAVEEAEYAPQPEGGWRVPVMSTWVAPFTVVAQRAPLAAAPMPALVTRLGSGVGGGQDEPRWQPPRCAVRTWYPQEPRPEPPQVWRVGAYNLAAWPIAIAPGPQEPPPGATPAALVLGPLLMTGEHLLLDRIERTGKTWTIIVSVWQDDGPRDKNIPHREVLAVPLAVDAPPPATAIAVRCRWMRAPDQGATYRLHAPPPGLAAPAAAEAADGF